LVKSGNEVLRLFEHMRVRVTGEWRKFTRSFIIYTVHQVFIGFIKEDKNGQLIFLDNTHF